MDQVTLDNDDEPFQNKVLLAACFRYFSRWGEGVRSHFSVQLPHGMMAIQNENIAWSKMEPNDLIVVDLHNPSFRPDTVSISAFGIHTELHTRLKSRAKCILHLHPPYATALACTLPGQLEMVHQNCAYFFDRVGYMAYPSTGTETTRDAVNALVHALGAYNRVVVQANHGVVVIGESVWAAFDDLFYFEQACRIYLEARRSGLPLNILSPDVCERIRDMRDRDRCRYGKLHMWSEVGGQANL